MQYFEHHIYIYIINCRVVVQALINKQNHTYSRPGPAMMVDAGVAGRRLRVDDRAQGGSWVARQRWRGGGGRREARGWPGRGGPSAWGQPDDGGGAAAGRACGGGRRRR
jgi:hypothetical protein